MLQAGVGHCLWALMHGILLRGDLLRCSAFSEGGGSDGE